MKQASSSSANIDGEKLLRLARSAIEQYLCSGKMPDQELVDEPFKMGSGIFVTLWNQEPTPKSGSPTEGRVLRGCIGHLQSNLPLYEFIPEVAIGAATRDPRFPPLAVAELETTKIEIAILSPLRLITDLRQIRIGEDGLLIEGMGKRGLLLPKVATRLNWDRAAFFEGVCTKAGLTETCWPENCDLFAFTTIVFDEDKPRQE
jgi:AmmeMemoRadiSam system protein A